MRHLLPILRRYGQRSLLTMILFVSFREATFSQVSISGPTCVSAGVQYQYTISGSWSPTDNMSWCVTGGTISGGVTCQSGTPLPSIYVTWNSGISSGSISLTATSGNSSLNVTITSALSGGSVSNSSQNINYDAVPATLNCSVASGGSCSPNYTYQWQQSTDDVNFTSITGATAQNLSFSSGLTQTLYYRRMVTETVSNSTAYSNVATVYVYPQLNPGSLSPSSLTISNNTNPGQITGSAASGGNGTYTYQWQSSTDYNSWNNISGATALNYTPGNLTTTTYFRRVVNSNGAIAFTNASTITVAPPLTGGSISTGDTVTANNTAPSITTVLRASGGNCSGSYSYQWQQSVDGGTTWTAISGGTAVDYPSSNVLTTNTLIRRMVTCGSETAYSNTLSFTVPLYAGIISVSSPVVMNSAGTVTLTGTAAGVSCTGNIYQWQSSPDEITWTAAGTTSTTSTSIANVSTTTYFRREVVCGNDAAFSNTVRVKLIPSVTAVLPNGANGGAATQTAIPMPGYASGTNPGNMNYIRTREVMRPGQTTTTAVAALTSTTDMHETTAYFDGLGRPVQTVAMEETPGGHDLVSTTFYDAYGRIAQQYLPYSDNGTTGAFRTDASTQQPAFYNSQFKNTEGFYYANNVYEASPLNRVLKTTAPGNSWTGSNVGVSQLERTNEFYDSVRIWTIGPNEDDLPATTFSYNPGTLFVTEATDENGNKTLQYKDLDGRLILKKVQINDALLPGHYGWLCTYYVYDDLDNLRFVIPPKAVDWLNSATNNWTLNLTLRNSLCFSYLYDSLKRMTMKLVPGAGKTYMVYDLRDRLVFSQDSVQRAAGQWLTTFYDGLNRPQMTALYPSTSSRATLQQMMNTTTAPPGTTVVYSHSSPAPANLVVNNRQVNIPQYTATGSITFLPGFSSATGDNFTALINASAQITTTDTLYEPSTANPVPNITGYQPLTYTYYDNYTWGGAKNFDSSPTGKLSAGSDPYPDAVTPDPTPWARGMVTGVKALVLNTTSEQWLATTTYYDDKNRVIQTLADNITGATDELTSQYDFAGRVLSTYLDHKNAHSGTTPETKILTTDSYDGWGRLLSVTKQLNDDATTQKTIASYSYNELGQLLKKSIGRTPTNPLDTLHYDYNIRGWLSGINKPYVNSTATVIPSPGNFFGTELDYDYGFNQPQVNGNIAGAKWKSAGDGYGRAFGYSYDNANRVVKADFTQNNSGTWNNTLPGSGTIDFSVSNLTYDANGNILTMNQQGLKVNQSSAIDQLTYNYQPNSNQLSYIADGANDPSTTLGDFHYSGTKSGSSIDYTYDGNGNLTKDQNKNISAISYNYLNLPQQVTVTGKGSIQFVYDATGKKWQKVVTDQTLSPNLATTTTYIGGFIYQSTSTGQVPSDTLQYLSQEEGRIRPKLTNPTLGYQAGNVQYVYDYFEKDHLGDTRMVLTEETQEDTYAATMEPQNATVENQLFSNISSTTVTKPTSPGSGFDTDPNNKQVSRVNGSSGSTTSTNPRVGPAIVLKVMAGDVVTIATQAWYQGPVQPPPTGAGNLLNDLLNALSGGVITNSGGKFSTGDNSPNGVLSGDLPQFFTNNENPSYNTAQPKAFLNWVAFDEQLNMVATNSGVVQVPAIGAGVTAQALVAPTQIIQKNGYIYIYVSNESAQDVFFDNLVIHHNRGPILEETHYYPFGLTMAGISSKALNNTPENKYRFNKGSELQNKEFSDGSGLELYATNLRSLDPQLGRWWQIDSKPDYSQSLYSAMSNNPILFNDPLGDTVLIQADKKTTLRYNNGALYNKDGSNYDGKLRGFLKKTFKALNAGVAGSKEAKSMIGQLESSKNNFTIIKGTGENRFDVNPAQRIAGYANQLKTDPNLAPSLAATPASAMSGGAGGTITWDPSGANVWVVGGVQNNNPTTNLMHELFHGEDANNGLLDDRLPDPSFNKLTRSEWQAVYHENIVRQQMGVPLRTNYISIVDENGNPISPAGPFMLTPTNQPLLPSWYNP